MNPIWLAFLKSLWGLKGIFSGGAVLLMIAALSGWPFKLKKFKLVGGVIAGIVLVAVLAPPVFQSAKLSYQTTSNLDNTPTGGQNLDLSECKAIATQGGITTATQGVRVQDKSDPGVTRYTSNSLRLQKGAAPGGKLTTVQATPTGTFADATTDVCTTYSVEGLSVAGSTGATDKIVFTSGVSGEEYTLTAYNMTYLQIRVDDINENGDSEHQFNDDRTSGTNSTSFTDLNLTNIYESAAAGTISVGSGGRIDQRVWLKAATNGLYGTDPNSDWFICADENTEVTTWKEPVVSFGGKKLLNDMDELKQFEKDGPLMAPMDFCYKVPKGKENAINDAGSQYIDYSWVAESGKNPDGTNDIPRMCIFSRGKFVSSDLVDTVLEGIYDDSSSPALVSHAAGYQPCWDIVVS